MMDRLLTAGLCGNTIGQDIQMLTYHSSTSTQPTFVCGAHLGMKWAGKWALCRIVRGFHNGPMPVAHMNIVKDCTCPKVGPNWATCARPISVPDFIFLWVLHGDNMGWKYGLYVGLSMGSMLAPCQLPM